MSACLGSVDFRGSVLREALLAVAGRSLFVVRDVKIFLVLFCVALMLVVCLAFSFLLRYRFLIVINRGGRVVATFGCVRRRFATFAAPARKKKKNLTQLVSLSDLESDYQNPIDMCRNANVWIMPEIGIHAALTLAMLLSGAWLELLLNAPLVAWHVHL